MQSDTKISYWIISIFVGFVFDYLIFDILTLFLAKYVSLVLKIVKYRGYYFDIPSDFVRNELDS